MKHILKAHRTQFLALFEGLSRVGVTSQCYFSVFLYLNCHGVVNFILLDKLIVIVCDETP